jgi:hypothetical protein
MPILQGGIVMWSGEISEIPLGWELCNGSNGTPDLRNRFVIGAGGTYSVGNTGGSANAIVPTHTHTGTTNTVGAHSSHTIGGFNEFGSGSEDFCLNITSQFTSTSNGSHNHSFTTASTGSSGNNANLPPYYALAFIMQIS